jgi:two-component system response regulator PilR (NtrC family)
VALLAELFVAEKAAELGVAEKRLAPEALAARERHSFPGNVRELENLIARALVLSDGEVLRESDLPLGSAAPPPALEQLIGATLDGGWPRLQALVKQLERQLLERAVAAHGERPNGEIARLLGTSRRVLELRLAEFGIAKRK